MDKQRELSLGAKVVLGATIAFLIVSIFNWFDFSGFGGWSMWHGTGFIAGLLALALLAWQLLPLANINLQIGLSSTMASAALAVLILLFAIIRFIDKPGSGAASGLVDRTFWAWLGLIFAIVLVAGAWLNMQAAGESLSDMKESMSTAASSAAAAARAATDKPSAPEAPSAPAPPAAPEPPSAGDTPAASAPPSTEHDQTH